MSADNAIYIQKRGDGLWWVWMGSPSNEVNYPDWQDASFGNVEEATAFAEGWARGELIVEHGIVFLASEIGDPIEMQAQFLAGSFTLGMLERAVEIKRAEG